MPTAPADRSPRDCTIADALEVVGDRWSLLVVREALLRPAPLHRDRAQHRCSTRHPHHPPAQGSSSTA
ncbi:hypothetical protein [Nocardioides convexus]|uniref:hypothetical protein n=1 Tax=Nocardioides convexus TaxID=2712224 RepID=UPI0024189E3B|nr:hypothetical protein [Nocardioides convexus]